MRMNKKERDQAIEIVMAETGCTLNKAKTFVRSMESASSHLHYAYEKACSEAGWLTADNERRIGMHEENVRAAFKAMGLGLYLYLNTDPRGNPIGILTPKTGRFNTLGGAECGWRL